MVMSDPSETSDLVSRLNHQHEELKRAHEELRRSYDHVLNSDPPQRLLSNRLLAQNLQDLTQQLALLHQGVHRQMDDAPVPLQAPLTEMLHVILYSRGVVSKLGALLTPPPLSKTLQSSTKVLDHVCQIAQERLAPREIHCEKRYATDLPPMAVDLPAFTEAVISFILALSEHLPSASLLRLQAEVEEGLRPPEARLAGGGLLVVTVTSSAPSLAPAFLLEGVPAWGLFAPHQILEAHQASVQVERIDDRLQLTFRLPYSLPTLRVEKAIVTTILMVEPQPDVAAPLVKFLSQEGFHVPIAMDGPHALKLIEEDPPDILIVSESLLEREGLECLAALKKADPLLPLALLSGYELTPLSQRALNAGVFQAVTRPFRKEEVLALVQKGLELRRVKQEIDLLRQQVAAPAESGLVLGDSPEMKNVMDVVLQVAPTDMTVIVQGESGVGKEVMARLIHRHSRRAAKPFIAIDCGALPESLVESELFGYERGAFTGADRRKLGHFELAQGGTVFLDEIGNLSLGVQAKLLRVLQERRIQRLGGRKEEAVDVRVVTASNVDLAAAVKAGQFREDLYHRLNEFTVHVPPLRSRPNDILLLAEVFRQEANQELGKRVTGFSPEVFNMLKAYPWPGNVRELKNTIKRSVLLADSTVLPEHLEVTLRLRQPMRPASSSPTTANRSVKASPEAFGVSAPSNAFPHTDPSELKRAAKHATAEVEKQLILEALQKTRYNKSEAAKLLGIDRTAVYYKMKK